MAGRRFRADAADLTRPLGGDRSGPGELIFLPYLGGERTPHNDAAIRGSFIGLNYTTDRTALARAVLEGVAFAFKPTASPRFARPARLSTARWPSAAARARASGYASSPRHSDIAIDVPEKATSAPASAPRALA
jgi:xylulokinase